MIERKERCEYDRLIVLAAIALRYSGLDEDWDFEPTAPRAWFDLERLIHERVMHYGKDGLSDTQRTL